MENEIVEIVNRETRAWDTKDVELLLSIFHKDMVWPWPPGNADHDPARWDLYMGKFDHIRWHKIYTGFFAEHRLVHNRRKIVKIVLSAERDGAFAVVDIDTRWESRKTGEKKH